MQSKRSTATLAALVIATGALVACTNDKPTEPTTTTPSPISVDPSSESSSSSTSSTSSASSSDDLPADYPEAAKENTKAGAAAFGKYYYEQMGDAGVSGDTSILKSLDARGCKVCENVISDIEKDAEQGWKMDKNPYSFSHVEATKRPDSGFKVAMDVSVAGHRRLDATGKENGHVAETNYRLTQHVVWMSGRWQMNDWVVT